MAEMTSEQEAHTFQARRGGNLFGGILMVASGVILAAVIGALSSQSVVFRILFGLGCFLYALFGIRFARSAVQVRGGQLIIRNYFRTRTVNASEVLGITLEQMRYGSTNYWVPRVHFTGGGDTRLTGLWSVGSRRAALVTTVEEILSLLGVHSPSVPWDPGISEQLPGQLPEQAAGQDPRSDLTGQSPVGLPSESIGTPGPPRRFRKGWRNALPIALVLAYLSLYVVNSTRGLAILILFGMALFNAVRFFWWRPRTLRARPHSFVSNPDDLNADHPGPDASRQG